MEKLEFVQATMLKLLIKCIVKGCGSVYYNNRQNSQGLLDCVFLYLLIEAIFYAM